MTKRAIIAFVGLFILSHPATAQILDVTDQDAASSATIAQQSQGGFNPLALREIPPGGAIQDAWDDAPATAGIVTYKHPENTTMKAALREGFVTSIVLTNDNILSSVLGDPTNFASKNGTLKNVLFLWPKATGYDTTLTIETDNGDVLAFYLRSETFNTQNITHTKIYVGDPRPKITPQTPEIVPNIDRSKPDDLPEIKTTEDLTDSLPLWAREAVFDPPKVRQDLEWSGDTELAPKDAFRDDKFTYLFWGTDNDGQKWPAVWAVEDGIDKPVRTRRTKDASYLVVETTGPLTLKRGGKTLCIRPKG